MFSDLKRPIWSAEGRDWPNRKHSRFVSSGGLSWHVQEMGEGPSLLLIHGTGAATHSFRDLAPRLADDFRVLMLDLPGHGFTQMPRGNGLSLSGMSRLVAGLLHDIGFVPVVAAGHSAGAAILAAMTLERRIAPMALVSLNGALRPIRGASLFSPLAKLLFLNPLAPRLFARRALDRDATRRLLEGTGSRLGPEGIDLYARLFRSSAHVAATLGMMAQWDLEGLERRLPMLSIPLTLLASTGDRAIPPSDAAAIASRVPSAQVAMLHQGGHLVHEERPDEVTAVIRQAASDAGVIFEDRSAVSRSSAAS